MWHQIAAQSTWRNGDAQERGYEGLAFEPWSAWRKFMQLSFSWLNVRDPTSTESITSKCQRLEKGSIDLSLRPTSRNEKFLIGARQEELFEPMR